MVTDRSIVIVVNPTSGRGRGRREADSVAKELSRRGIPVRVHETSGPGQAEKITREMVRDANVRPRCGVACGGGGGRCAAARWEQISIGLNSGACSSSSVTLRPALSGMKRKRSGSGRITSSVCRPMEPVEPRIATPVGLIGRWEEIAAKTGSKHDPYREIVYQRHREQQ